MIKLKIRYYYIFNNRHFIILIYLQYNYWCNNFLEFILIAYIISMFINYR